MRANALLYAHVHAAARAEFEARALGAGSKFVGFHDVLEEQHWAIRYR